MKGHCPPVGGLTGRQPGGVSDQKIETALQRHVLLPALAVAGEAEQIFRFFVHLFRIILHLHHVDRPVYYSQLSLKFKRSLVKWISSAIS